MIWKPHVTVAAVIERNGKFLMVEELADGQVVYNQPAGHLEEGESIAAAVVREVQEETAWEFIPEAITGIYHWRKPGAGETFVRFCFTGTLAAHAPTQPLDAGILAAPWLSHDELLAQPAARLRSPMVRKCLADYLSGQRYSMDIIHAIDIP